MVEGESKTEIRETKQGLELEREKNEKGQIIRELKKKEAKEKGVEKV